MCLCKDMVPMESALPQSINKRGKKNYSGKQIKIKKIRRFVALACGVSHHQDRVGWCVLGSASQQHFSPCIFLRDSSRFLLCTCGQRISVFPQNEVGPHADGRSRLCVAVCADCPPALVNPCPD